jgi:hypothetical protein
MNFLTRLIKRIRNYFKPNQTGDKAHRRPAVTDALQYGQLRRFYPDVLSKPPVMGRQQHTPITTAAPRMRSVGRGTMVRDRDSPVTVTNSYAVNSSQDTSISTAIITAVVVDTILNTYTPEPNYDPPSFSCSNDGDSGGD